MGTGGFSTKIDNVNVDDPARDGYARFLYLNRCCKRRRAWCYNGISFKPSWDHHGANFKQSCGNLGVLMGPSLTHLGTILWSLFAHHGFTQGSPWDHCFDHDQQSFNPFRGHQETKIRVAPRCLVIQQLSANALDCRAGGRCRSADLLAQLSVGFIHVLQQIPVLLSNRAVRARHIASRWNPHGFHLLSSQGYPSCGHFEAFRDPLGSQHDVTVTVGSRFV